jgi:hypothetical protein
MSDGAVPMFWWTIQSFTSHTMFSANATSISTILLLMAAVGTCLFLRHVSPEAKQERRRRKNHGRVVIKARRPVVSLFCRVRKA